MELLVIIAVTLIMVPVALLTEGFVRIALGIAFLIFFPGYSLLAALFPRKGSLEPVERIGLTFVLSLAVVPLIGLILNYTPWGIRLYPIIGFVAAFILLCSAVALYRRRRLDPAERFEPRLRIRRPQWPAWSVKDKVLAAALVICIFGAVGTLAYVIAVPRYEERFSEFYVLGAGDMAADYPHEIVFGEALELTVGIANREGKTTTYRIEVRIDGEKVTERGPIQLASEVEWSEKVNVEPVETGESQKVEYLLYKDELTEPYLALHLWLDVLEPECE